jgi:predicted dehydrogenase
VDAVIAVTTPNLNPVIAASCIQVGKPLLVEKPMAVDGESAARMVTSFAAAGLPLTVGQTLRFNRIVLALRKEFSRIGELYAFSAHHRLEESGHAWPAEPQAAGGGVILNTAVHLFDALRFITGREVLRVRAETQQRHNPRLEDLFLAIVELEGGVRGTVDAAKLGPARSARFEFIGSQGQIHGDHIHGTLEFFHGRERILLPPPETVNTLIPMLQSWEAHLRGRGENPISGEEGLAAVRICDACRRSALEGCEIHVVAPSL